jgi:DNA-binding transcriptional LysR family regulator
MNSIKMAPLLLTFGEVARFKSFTKAAKSLAMSKSAISQQISRLEEATGEELLVRNTRGVVLTIVGEALLSRTQLLNEQVILALDDLQSAKTQPTGKFKVAVPPFFERDLIALAINQLCSEYPGVVPEVIVTGKWTDLVENGLDCAIFGGTLKDSRYRALPIGDVSEVILASASYVSKVNTSENESLLCTGKFIATPWQNCEVTLFDVTTQQMRHVQISHSVQTTSVSAALEMAICGMGLLLYPKFLAKEAVFSRKLLHIEPNLQGRAWTFYFVHNFQKNKPAHINRFYQLICYYFNELTS